MSSIMMPDPLWVITTGSAMEALEMMLETHSRHLPVSIHTFFFLIIIFVVVISIVLSSSAQVQNIFGGHDHDFSFLYVCVCSLARWYSMGWSPCMCFRPPRVSIRCSCGRCRCWLVSMPFSPRLRRYRQTRLETRTAKKRRQTVISTLTTTASNIDNKQIEQVVSEEGAVSGLLNIAKCLYDAIHRLEKKAARAEAEGAGISDEKQELAASLLKVCSTSTSVICVLYGLHVVVLERVCTAKGVVVRGP